MRVLSFVIIVILVLVAIFAAVNWAVLAQSTPLSFVAFEIQGPLGIIMLGITLAIVALVIAYALLLRTTWLMESHRLSREIQKQRELAEQAESSRVFDLQNALQDEFAKLREALKEASDTSVARTESAEKTMSVAFSEAINTLTAHIGYLDDRLAKATGNPDSGDGPSS